MRRISARRVVRVLWRATQVVFVAGVLFAFLMTGLGIEYIYRKAQEVPPLDPLEYGEVQTWKQHTEIFAAVPALAAGQGLDHIRRRLARRAYLSRPTGGLTAGSYRDEVSDSGDGTLVIFPRPFIHPRLSQTPEPFTLTFADGVLQSIQTADGSARKTVYLEPELLDELYNVDEGLARQLIRLDEAPDDLINAFIAIEDSDFYKHPGIHARRFFVAMVRNVLYGRLHGASTITQQLARNILLTRDKKVARKVKEWVLAVRIERRYSKDEILERYLNFIDFGKRGNRTLYGVKEAARFLFDKDVTDLDLAESALLAAIPNAPSRYSPVLHPDNALRRRNLVLSQMLRRGYITREAYARARTEPIQLAKRKRRAGRDFAPYFVSYVRAQLERRYTPEQLYASGLRVYTTLDPVFQEAAARAVRTQLRKLDAELGYPSYRDTLARVEQGTADASVLQGYIQGGLVMMDARTGFIRSLVGGRDFSRNEFNHVTQAKRQPGSAFKPFVYTAAWAKGLVPDDTILDEPWSIGDWQPEDYTRTYAGEVTLRLALEKSLNIPAARLMNEHVGINAVRDIARRMGIQAPLPPYPSLALGVAEVTPLELTAAYSPFANLGVRVEPIAVQYVVTLDGTILEENVPRRTQAVDPVIAYTTTELLTGVIDEPFGTGHRARLLGFTYPAGGKTGTTSNYTDAWFIGFTPAYIAGVWVGFDDPAKSTERTGSKGALPIWADFMKSIVRGPALKFEPPRGYGKMLSQEPLSRKMP